MEIQTAYIETPLGIAILEGNNEGITRISIQSDIDKKELKEEIPDILMEGVKQVKEYFNGERTTFNLTLNPQGTDFQKKVWKELEKISFGKTVSYLEIAKRLGDVKTIRAAASANGKNPLWVIIPCHRVIGSDGSLTGYAGGLWRKKWLLEHESPAKQQSLF